ALSTLTSTSREQFYARVAVAVEDVFADSHDGHLEMLAHYYAQSRDLPKSLHYLEQAGEKAAALGAADRAAELWGRARNVAVRAGDEDAVHRLDERLATADASVS